MADPRILVLRAAGVNCNEETAFAFTRAGAAVTEVHINRLLENPLLLDQYVGCAVPGGFSYGDDIAAGKIMAVEIGHVLGDAFRRLVGRGGILIGICNGFQVLIKTGLLPGTSDSGHPIAATLVENTSNRYEDRWVRLAPTGKKGIFFRDDEPLELPCAHGEGRFVARTAADLDVLEREGRVALRYVNSDGSDAAYPANPNGSANGIAAITDSTGQILGMMPHPERHLFPYQHPEWTRRPIRNIGDGARIFENAVAFLRS